MSEPQPKGPPRLGYMPGVDGLRALAVTAVVVYHLGASWLPGGYLGVDVFLVVSGYLITSLLLAERRRSGRIDLGRFWVRRAFRLLPAVLVMLVLVLAAMVILHPGEVARLRGATLASLGYVANWYFVFADVPYFEQFGRPSVLQHLWSLAVEEQFYLLWPPILAVGLLLLSPRRMLPLIVALIAASTALAWVLYDPFTDPSRIYYGTDTRGVALLVGVALALAWPAGTARPLEGRRSRIVLDVVGVLALGGVFLALFTLGDLDRRLYQGGFLVVALATAALIAVAAHPSSRLAKVLGVSVLVWIGLRSYAIYLWHWPVIMLTRPNQDVPFDGPALLALRIGLIVVLAALSYRFVERPIRRMGPQGVKEAYGRWKTRTNRPFRVATTTGALACLGALALAVALATPSTPSVPGLTTAAAAETRAQAAPGPAVLPTGATESSDPTAAGGPILFVGDSVMLSAAPALEQRFGARATIDAEVGREFTKGAQIIRGTLPRMPADTTVVIHLGNNDFIRPEDLDALLAELQDGPKVVLVTVRVPLKWQDSVNEALRSADARFDNVVIADWYAVSGGPGLLVDGAHVNEKGAALYAETIAEQLR